MPALRHLTLSLLCLLTIAGAVLMLLLWQQNRSSGVLTTQGTFTQKYGYFEIRAKVPVGIGVWPAF